MLLINILNLILTIKVVIFYTFISQGWNMKQIIDCKFEGGVKSP